MRGLLAAIDRVSIAAALASEARGLLCFGPAFLSEELHKMGVILLILSAGRRREERALRPVLVAA